MKPVNELRIMYQSFSEYLNQHGSIPYDAWLQLEYDSKAASLFVTYYNNIYLAYSKCLNMFKDDEYRPIELIIHTLMKNVDKLICDSKRYNASYMYKITWNCLYIYGQRNMSNLQHMNSYNCYEHVKKDGESTEFDIFDNEEILKSVVNISESYYRSAEHEYAKTELWRFLEDCGEQTMELALHLIKKGKILKGMSSSSKKRKNLDMIKTYLTSEYLNCF